MRWMKRLAAGVLAAGMALALLTACGSSKNDGVAPPVPTSVPETRKCGGDYYQHNSESGYSRICILSTV